MSGRPRPTKHDLAYLLAAVIVLLISGMLQGCDDKAPSGAVALKIPRGYVDRLYIDTGERLRLFGPFVGYYFKPETPGDLSRLRFVCFNERQFYTTDLPANTHLYDGEARLTRLPEVDYELPRESRINPVYFKQAPALWLGTRPDPRDQFVHFHSCYDASGPLRTGYWLRHIARDAFIYDMGGRVAKESPLYHEVDPGPDTAFARIIEFDRGP